MAMKMTGLTYQMRSAMLVWLPALLWLLLGSANSQAQQPPPWLPRYDLNVHIDVDGHFVTVRERVTWTNRHARPARSIVFNNHSHFSIPDKDVGLLSKTLEVLRLAPSEALDFGGPPCEIQRVAIVDPGTRRQQPIGFGYREDNQTALEIALPFEVRQGQSVTLDIAFQLRLPQRQGRWGQWHGVTFLAQWLPVVSYYDDRGWQPAPFVPWHQPFHNEAGIYNTTITMPGDEVLGCTGSIQSVVDLQNGWKKVTIGEVVARDFSIFCSKQFREVATVAGGVKIRCLHLPGHEFYGKEMVRIAAEAIPIYQNWFGPFPYPEFTVVESYFGWNGNECGGVVMIDERVFSMPHMALGWVDNLLTHEICHQYWYNVVGTNGYAETWMDESVATHYSHRITDMKLGKNNPILKYPWGLEWMPNIYRNDFRNQGMYGTMARGEAMPCVQPMPKFGHLLNLTAMTYDRGSKVFGMIEKRLGPAGTLDFMRLLYRKYYFRILHVADFQRELEAYTNQSWQEFFDQWLYGAGMSDWCMDRVEVEPLAPGHHGWSRKFKRWMLNKTPRIAGALHGCCDGPYRVTVYVRQKGEYTEPTVLGFSLDGSGNYQIRVPILPAAPTVIVDELNARMETVSHDLVRVTIDLPTLPTQITVDPDQVVLDREPSNNHWKTKVKVRVSPMTFFLDETDVTTAYDQPNLIIGPWLYGSTFSNPWFTRSPLFGLRAGLYRPHQYNAGAYLAYRSNDRNLVAGVDGVLRHYPFPQTEVGFQAEQSLATLGDEDTPCSRLAIYGRYVMMPTASLYLQPAEYVEVFGAYQNRCLPDSRQIIPGAKLFEDQTSLGVHYHKKYLTPYWDPEGGIDIDATYQAGIPVFGQDEDFHQVFGQVATVKYMPDPFKILDGTHGLHWLTDTRFAFRLYGAAALPDDGQFFSLGGGDLFRGFDLAERQGSSVWVGSIEWRVPLVKGVHKDYVDHVAGLRNIYGVAFYDVGNAYLFGKQFGPVAHAVGGGLRFDVTWLGLIERTMLRFDVAQTVNADTPLQFWFGIQHPF